MKLSKFPSIQSTVLALALLSVAQMMPVARAGEPAGDLAIKGTAFLGKNHKDMLLVLNVENVSDHPVTVLTKKLAFLANFAEAPVSANFIVGYTSEANGGQTSIPSVYELAPVTLAPKDKTVIKYEVRNENQLKHVTHDTELVCTYEVSDDWANKLKVTGANVKTEAFKPNMIPAGAMPH